MASTISSIDSSLKNLAPAYQTTIKQIIEAESTSLNKVQAQKDQLEVRRSVYSDVKSNFSALQSAVQALISSQAAYSLSLVSKASVVPSTAGTTVLTATNTDTAHIADYDITVSQLAKANIRATAAVTSPEEALNKSGTFWLGGTGTAALQTETASGVYSTFVGSTSVTAAYTSTVASGQRELGTGNYSLQVRDSGGVRQFRLVNADGEAVSIRNIDGTSTYTSAWQKMKDTTYDTGRGQILALNTLGSLDATTFHYTAKGTSITISATQSQQSIAAAINAAIQPEGRDFKASIVSNQLVLTGVHTGENHAIIFSDEASLGFNTTLQTAQNAKFVVNGMDVARSRNTDLTDIVDGATLALAADAEGKTARLSISVNPDKAVGLMNTMVTKFNAALTHLKEKLASTSKTVGDKTTYSRGPLTGDTVFSGLRTDILYNMSRSYSNSGSYSRLEEIGLSFDKDLKLTFDSTKFNDAIKNHASDLTALLDAGMGNLNTVLARYTGTSGILTNSLTSIDSQSKSFDQRIAKYNASLEFRKTTLYNRYMEYQSQLADLGRTAQMFGINLTGGNINTSG